MIRCERASVERGGQLVLEAVSLQVRAGESWALIGAGGAGKSMLVAAAATAEPLHAGDILVEGRSVRRETEAVRRLAGYVPERLPDWPGLRAGEFLELFAAAAGLRGAELARAVGRGLDLAGLAGRGGVELESLDACRAKRLLVARGLGHDPRVLLLDDPFSGLDPDGRRDLERILSDAQLMGRTVLAAIDDARVPGCFTHLAMLAEGRLVAEGRNDPDTFAAGRHWRYALRVPGRADEAARAVEPLTVEAAASDGDTVVAVFDPSVVAAADLVAAVVRAGLPVDVAGYDPPWQAQLLDR
jgi:ABC-2 type transport system ATP-binding protein